MNLKRGQNSAKYIEKKVAVMGRFYTRAYNSLLSEIEGAAGTLWKKKRAKELLSRVDAIVEKMDEKTKAFITAEIPTTYRKFAAQTRKDIERGKGVVLGKQFSQVHQDAAQNLADDAYLKFGQAMQTVKRSVQGTITQERRIVIREIIASGKLTGEAALDIAKQIKAELRRDGITALVDKSGRRWQLNRYSEMLARQTLATASREAVRNVAVENDLDVVKFTRHGSKHNECAVWEGKRVSLTGATKGMPTLDDAIGEGMLHVGCLHGYFVDV